MPKMQTEKGVKYIENIEITDVHSSGRAIAKHGNRSIYVDYVVPGDVVMLRVVKHQKGKFTLGTINDVSYHSKHRIEAICNYFGTCGGCNWMYFSYDSQLEWKYRILLKALEKYAILVPTVPPLLPSPNIYYYRNKLEFAFGEDESRKIFPSFHPINKPYQYFKIEKCYLQAEYSVELAAEVASIANDNGIKAYNFVEKCGELRNLIIRTSQNGDILLIIGLTDFDKKVEKFLSNLVSGLNAGISIFYTILTNPVKGHADNALIHLSGKRWMNQSIGDIKYQIGPGTFLQPNPLQASNLYSKIKEFADLKGDELVYDLYTGAGTIACFLAKYTREIIGIEGSSHSIADANINARLNGIDNVKFLTGDILKTFTPQFVDENGKPDVIILDPPRAGTLIEIKKNMILIGPEKIIYVSCNPVSLAWDLKQLTEKYFVKAIQPFDMFPHTHHVETVVLLERKDRTN